MERDGEHIGCLAKVWLRTSGVHSSGICRGAGLRETEKAGRLLCPPDGVRRLTPGFCLGNLAARLCGGSTRLRIRFWDAEGAAYPGISNLVDFHFFCNVRTPQGE